jgi:hypothetical protein
VQSPEAKNGYLPASETKAFWALQIRVSEAGTYRALSTTFGKAKISKEKKKKKLLRKRGDSRWRERIKEKSAANESLNGNYSPTNRSEFFNFSEIGVSSVSRAPRFSPRSSGGGNCRR